MRFGLPFSICLRCTAAVGVRARMGAIGSFGIRICTALCCAYPAGNTVGLRLSPGHGAALGLACAVIQSIVILHISKGREGRINLLIGLPRPDKVPMGEIICNTDHCKGDALHTVYKLFQALDKLLIGLGFAFLLIIRHTSHAGNTARFFKLGEINCKCFVVIVTGSTARKKPQQTLFQHFTHRPGGIVLPIPRADPKIKVIGLPVAADH